MARHDPSSMPFGYAFEEALGQHDPHLPPSGPPLLSQTEFDGLNSFWSDPEHSTYTAGDPMFEFDFGGVQQDASHIFAPDLGHPTLNQPQPSQPLPRSHEQPANDSGGEDGSLIAEALMSMAYDQGGAQRTATPRKQHSTTANPPHEAYAPNVLNAVQYPAEQMNHLVSHAPVHATSMRNFHRTSNAQPWNATTRQPQSIMPNGLQFDSDHSFATGGARPNYNAYSIPNQASKQSQNLENHVFMPVIAHSNDFLNNASGVLAQYNTKPQQQQQPSPSINRMAEAARRLSQADKMSKRMRMEPVRTHSMPVLGNGSAMQQVKTENAAPEPPRRSSSASNISHDSSASPAANGKASKRNQKATQGKSGAASKRQKLSSEQRKANHILSEKRRRGEMQRGYAALDKLVPSLKSNGLSKSQVLQHTVVFLDALIKGNDKVEAEIARREALAGAG